MSDFEVHFSYCKLLKVAQLWQRDRASSIDDLEGLVNLRLNFRLMATLRNLRLLHFERRFQTEGVSLTNHRWCQSSRVIALSFDIKICAVHHLVLSQSTRVTDRRTDRQTELRPSRPPSHKCSRGKNPISRKVWNIIIESHTLAISGIKLKDLVMCAKHFVISQKQCKM